MSLNLYTYRANVTSVYDGDTCTVNIDLGLHTWLNDEKIRLNRINTPEIRGEERTEGLIARDRLRELVSGKSIILQTVEDKQEKYGRYLGELWVMDEMGKMINVNDLLVREGHAQYYMTTSTEPLASPV